MEISRTSTRRAPQDGRGLRYRTSCDNCQAAKIKCGQDKPSCRRCSLQALDCVYSLSRRMGRPRQTKEPAARTGSCRTPPATTSHDRPQSDQSTSLFVSQTGAEITAPTHDSPVPAPEQYASKPLPAGERNQSSCTSGNLIDDLHPELMATTGILDEQPGSQPRLISWHSSFPTQSQIAFDNFPSIPEMPPYPDDTMSDPTMSRNISSAPRTGLSERQDVLEPRLPTALGDGAGSFDGRIDPQLGQTSATTRDSYPGSHSHDQAFHEETSSGSGTPLMDQLQDIEFDFFLDTSGSSSRELGSSSTPSNILRQEISHPRANNSGSILKPSRRTDFFPFDEEDWSGSQESSDRKKYNCNCSLAISKDIGVLRAEQQKATTMPVDRALKMESEIEETLTRFVRCVDRCCHDSIVHLLAFISLEMTLNLLQETARHEFKPPRSKRSSLSQGGTAIRRWPHPQQTSAEVCNLYIGSYKVAPGARLRFLRRVLQVRFHKLAEFVKDREEILNGLKQDCTARAAALLLEDISRGLHTITGWIEVWGR
jgi:Fungal Zn(2)-Cys(6) binuclear cluster domain